VTVAVVMWQSDGLPRWEQAHVTLEPGRLSARGTALVGSTADSGPYRVDYELDTVEDYLTRRLTVRAESAAWRRELWLRRETGGAWTARRIADPVDRVEPVPDPVALLDAVDCDLAWSPLTNTMPVLRHRLHQQPGDRDLVMAWVSVPDLVVHPSRQRYQHLRPGVVRFAADRFQADLQLTEDGLVAVYPQLGHVI
jgi:hypothetical protein